MSGVWTRWGDVVVFERRDGSLIRGSRCEVEYVCP